MKNFTIATLANISAFLMFLLFIFEFLFVINGGGQGDVNAFWMLALLWCSMSLFCLAELVRKPVG